MDHLKRKLRALNPEIEEVDSPDCEPVVVEEGQYDENDVDEYDEEDEDEGQDDDDILLTLQMLCKKRNQLSFRTFLLGLRFMYTQFDAFRDKKALRMLLWDILYLMDTIKRKHVRLKDMHRMLLLLKAASVTVYDKKFQMYLHRFIDIFYA